MLALGSAVPQGTLRICMPASGEHTRGELNALVIYVDVRIGLTLYSSSCSTRYELNLLLGRKEKMSVGKNVRKKKCFAKTPHKGVIRGN
jgi:hypothetical protein